MDDTCECPVGRYEGPGGFCRELKPNEYYAAFPGCPALLDTMFFEIIEKTSQHIIFRVQADSRGSYAEESLSLLPMAEGGDSLFTIWGSGGGLFSPRGDFINGRLVMTMINGRFIENDTKIRMTVRYFLPDHEPVTEVDRCEFVFHQ